MSNVQPQLVLRAKLYDALISGDYVQAQGNYRRPPTRYDELHGNHSTGYCILGLAYEVMGGKQWNTFFHPQLEEAYGFRNTITLMSLNDCGCSFKSFARMMKDHPEFVFNNN